jgi:hypothetical protein
MGKPLMIQNADDERIEDLKQRIGAKTKVDVVRRGLDLLEKETERAARIRRWQKAAKAASSSSQETNLEFQKSSRMKKMDK